MKKYLTYLYILVAVFMLTACTSEQKPKEEVTSDEADKKETTNEGNVANIPVYDFKGFESKLYINNDTTYVVNFWATWCKPCVAELPYFEQLHENYKDQKVKVLLVSLDFSTQIEKKLIPFIKQRQLKPEVIVLDDPDANGWIDKVNPKWSGAIPATIIFKGDKRGFFEQSFESYAELVEVMEGVVNE